MLKEVKKNKKAKSKKKINPLVSSDSWMSDMKRLFARRVSQMNIGDALISADGDWRIDCLRDDFSTTGVEFAVYRNNKECLFPRRKKASTIVGYLVSNDAPADLTLNKASAILADAGIKHLRSFGILKQSEGGISVTSYDISAQFSLTYLNFLDDVVKMPAAYVLSSPIQQMIGFKGQPLTSFVFIDEEEE